jgi:hypothetical protein
VSNNAEIAGAVVIVVLIAAIAYAFGSNNPIFAAPTTSVTFLSTSTSTTTIAYAGILGEYSGQLNFELKSGTSETLQLSLLNQGNLAINVTVGLQGSLSSHNQNVTTPPVTFSQTTVAIPPGSSNSVNVTVFVPSSDNINGTSWKGLVSAQCESGCGGGVAKVITISVV